jgi:hypothetical protein
MDYSVLKCGAYDAPHEQVSSQTRVQERLEACSVLNIVNFRAPHANRSAADYGTITGTFDARQLQLGIKLMF